MRFVLLIFFVLSTFRKVIYGTPEKVTLGAVFSTNTDEVRSALRYALLLHNENRRFETSGIRFQAEAIVNVVDPYDAYTLSNILCAQLGRGMFAAIGTTDSAIYKTMKSFTNLFQMPYISNGLPPALDISPLDFSIDMRPDFIYGITETIKFYGWKQIIYLYDSDEGLLKLQQILQIASMKSGLTNSFSTVATMKSIMLNLDIRMAHRIYNASHANAILLQMERIDRESKKYIVLDCTTATAKQIIINHVRNVHMGKRNYHYLLTNLNMDEPWDPDVSEYTAINITGYKVMNPNSEYFKEFIGGWQSLDSVLWPGAGTNYVTAKAAFMFDGVRVILDALIRILLEKRNVFRENVRRGKIYNNGQLGIRCDQTKDIVSWEHGQRIMDYIKQTNIKGLTGNISFDEYGRRRNFVIDIVEIGEKSEMSTVAKWSDEKGFIALKERFERTKPNKTYTVTTILEEPYLFFKSPEPGQLLSGNDRFDGYCADLARMIGDQLHIKYVLKLVDDGQYGTYKPERKEGWDGMIGELINGEADIAIAPLTITSERERVIDFTKPYMSQGISLMIKKPVKQKPGVFSFMNPLSKHIWICIIAAYIGVSLVLFLVSRFSPYEWHILNTSSGPVVSNEFSIYNSLWFALGAFMQQGCDICPRSISGRIVGSCWWLFTLIIVSSYTANLAAFLTVERMIAPINSAAELSKQTEVEYGIYASGSTYDFFRKSKITVYATMWRYMKANPHLFAKSNEDGIARVRKSKGKYAFLLESAQNDYINERQPCDTIKVGRNLDSKGYGLATPLGSPISESLNLAVLHLKENGDLARLENKWWYDRSECKNAESKDSQQNELTLSNVAGIFYLLIGGLVIAMVVVFLEFFYKSRVDSKYHNVPLSASMKAKAKMSIRGSDADTYPKYYPQSNQMVPVDGITEPTDHIRNTHTLV
ncbi:GRIA2 (predicted) [Pycnogonum litorale]